MFFEPQTGRRLEFLGHQEKINSIDLSPNGHFALTGGNDYVAYLWDTRTGQVIHRFSHPSRVTKVTLDDAGRYAFTADSKKQARIWDLQTGEFVSELVYRERQKIFSAAAFSKDGKYLLTGSPSRSLILWNVATGQQIKEWRVAPRESSKPPSAVVYAVGFLSDTEVMSISSSGLAEVWQL
jgi:WD40 repeat protein